MNSSRHSIEWSVTFILCLRTSITSLHWKCCRQRAGGVQGWLTVEGKEWRWWCSSRCILGRARTMNWCIRVVASTRGGRRRRLWWSGTRIRWWASGPMGTHSGRRGILGSLKGLAAHSTCTRAFQRVWKCRQHHFTKSVRNVRMDLSSVMNSSGSCIEFCGARWWNCLMRPHPLRSNLGAQIRKVMPHSLDYVFNHPD